MLLIALFQYNSSDLVPLSHCVCLIIKMLFEVLDTVTRIELNIYCSTHLITISLLLESTNSLKTSTHVYDYDINNMNEN